MKNKMYRHHGKLWLAVAVLFTTLLFGGVNQAQAQRYYRNSYDQRGYDYQSRDGYRDHNGYYHRYGYNNNQRGYWRERKGLRFWINVD
jgi:hypothetical protein